RSGWRSTTRSRGLGGLLALVALVALAAGLPSSFAGDPPPAPLEGPPLDNPQVQRGAGAAAVLWTGVPTGAGSFQRIALLSLGERIGCWALRDPSHVLPLDRRYFHAVRDGTPLPTAIKVDETQFQEAMVYYDAVRKANST